MQSWTQQFGGKMTEELRTRYAKSPQWKNGRFENLEETTMDIHFTDMPNLLYQQLVNTKGRNPKQPLPIEPFNSETFLSDSSEPKFIWYGHSTVLMRWKGKTILMDPMLGPNASPIAPFSTKRFSESTLDLIDQFPEIDLLMMTHDHYDHLDMASINRLKDKTKEYFVAMGVGRHLKAWGISPENVHEFDWWGQQQFADIEITFTPSRHFSGRGMKDRAKSLWGGWTFRTNDFNLYWSGDGGYGDHFKEIGDKLGPFDLGFMECGQYNEHWHQIHMYPEESIQAAIDAGVQKAVPVHWGGFALSLHTWKEPIERFSEGSKTQSLNIITPRLGEFFSNTHESREWWLNID